MADRKREIKPIRLAAVRAVRRRQREIDVSNRPLGVGGRVARRVKRRDAAGLPAAAWLSSPEGNSVASECGTVKEKGTNSKRTLEERTPLMSTLTSCNGLQVVSPAPTGAGGLAINNNFKALSTHVDTVNPTTSDDGTQGFVAGSRWYNSSTTVEWICTSNATGAAAWTAVASGALAGYLPLPGGTMSGDIDGVGTLTAVTVLASSTFSCQGIYATTGAPLQFAGGDGGETTQILGTLSIVPDTTHALSLNSAPLNMNLGGGTGGGTLNMPVREFEGYRRFFSLENESQSIRYNYRPPGDCFGLGRVSRDDAAKHSADSWTIFHNVRVPREKKVFMLGYGPNAAERCGKPPDGLDWTTWPPGTMPVREFYDRIHCMVYKTGGSRESYGRIVPEAYAAGVAVVVEDDYAFPALVEDGVTGFRCKSSDEMSLRASELAFDEPRRKRMVEAGRRFLENEIASREKCWQPWKRLLGHN
jgi:hypothetical protein